MLKCSHVLLSLKAKRSFPLILLNFTCIDTLLFQLLQIEGLSCYARSEIVAIN